MPPFGVYPVRSSVQARRAASPMCGATGTSGSPITSIVTSVPTRLQQGRLLEDPPDAGGGHGVDARCEGRHVRHGIRCVLPWGFGAVGRGLPPIRRCFVLWWQPACLVVLVAGFRVPRPRVERDATKGPSTLRSRPPVRDEAGAIHGEHQVADQAHQDQPEGHRAQQGVQVGAQDAIRRANDAVAAGDKDKAVAALALASKKLDKAVSKGVIHKNQAANRKSAIAKKVSSL